MYYFIIGMIIGILFSVSIFVLFDKKIKQKNDDLVGALRIDTSDSDGPYIFLELHKEMQDIINKKVIKLAVDLKDICSHK